MADTADPSHLQLCRDVSVLRADLAALSRSMTEWRAADRDLFAEWRASGKDALALQAKEYERRLEELNNSQDRAIQIQATYVNKDALRLETDDIRHRLDLNIETQSRTTLDVARLVASVGQVTSAVAALATSQTWITRLVISAVIIALLGVVLTGGSALLGVPPPISEIAPR